MQSDYEKTYKTYKELILEVVDTHLLPPADYPYWREESPDYSYWRERYKEVKNPWGDIGVACVGVERIKDIDEEFREVVDRLTCTKRTFFGYDMGDGRLVRNWYDVAGWMDNIKSTKRLTHHSDIKTAIYKEMARHEKENGLVLETPGAGGEDRQSGQPATIQQGVKLVMITRERRVYWEGEKQGELPNKPYQFLYVLALYVGEGPVSYAKVKWLVESDTESLPKAISRHIGTIKARIPPLQNIIHNEKEIGYMLTLQKDEVQVIGKMSEVDTLLNLPL